MVEFGSKTYRQVLAQNLRKCHLVVDLGTKALEVWFFSMWETQISMKLYSKPPESFWEPYLLAIYILGKCLILS